MTGPSHLNFIRQNTGPLYPNILYNRPITRQGAGKLLVPGGHTGELSLPAALQQLALAAGAGECIVALPDVVAKLIAGAPGTIFVPSSPSGSLGSEALGRLLHAGEDADAVLLGASLSNNSHTAILIERLVQELGTPAVIFGDAVTALQHHIQRFTDRPDTLAILTMPEVFKLAGALGIPIQIRRDGGLVNKLEIVRDLAAAGQCHLAVYGSEIIVAAEDNLIVTPVNWRLSQLPAAYWAVLATFWTQNPARRSQGLATGAYVLHQAAEHIEPTGRPNLATLTRAIARIIAASDF